MQKHRLEAVTHETLRALNPSHVAEVSVFSGGGTLRSAAYVMFGVRGFRAFGHCGWLLEGHIHGWMDGRMDGWMDGRMDGLIDGCLG